MAFTHSSGDDCKRRAFKPVQHVAHVAGDNVEAALKRQKLKKYQHCGGCTSKLARKTKIMIRHRESRTFIETCDVESFEPYTESVAN